MVNTIEFQIPKWVWYIVGGLTLFGLFLASLDEEK